MSREQYRIIKFTARDKSESFRIQKQKKFLWKKYWAFLDYYDGGKHYYNKEEAEEMVKELLTEPKSEIIGYYTATPQNPSSVDNN